MTFEWDEDKTSLISKSIKSHLKPLPMFSMTLNISKCSTLSTV